MSRSTSFFRSPRSGALCGLCLAWGFYFLLVGDIEGGAVAILIGLILAAIFWR